MLVLLIFIIIIAFCAYIYFGLYITEGLETTIQMVLTWSIYTTMWLTLLNMIMLSYFWYAVRTKQGPYGLRGPQGERGKVGLEGQCSITATQAYCVKAINEYIDSLYKLQTGISILNDDTQTFPCRYLNNKITTQAGSRQYQVIVANLTNDNKPVENISNYLKSIWKVWFDLLYNATTPYGQWFTDEFADEEYSWNDSNKNPFTEIKKYDIYYWGVTRDFRPLKAEICRSTPLYQNSKVPIKNNKPKLKIMQTNDYITLGMDKKAGGSPDESWHRPKKVTLGTDIYYPVGDVVMSGDGDTTWYGIYKNGPTIIGDMQYNVTEGGAWAMGTINGPDIKTVVVSGDETVLADPIGYDYIWSNNGKYNPGILRPKCPNGFTDMGDVMSAWGDMKRGNPVKCVISDCVEDVGKYGTEVYRNGNLRLRVLNNWNWSNYEATPDNSYNLMRSNNGKFKKIKQSCLVPSKSLGPETKEVETQFDDLGIGWYGHPYKLDPKYSIFSFLNLVPEGMIVNKSTGRRFYIVHYGGEEANIYVVLDYRPETDKFNNALQVGSVTSDIKIESRSVSRMDTRQQWNIILQQDKTQLKLKNIFNKKYLYIGVSSPQSVKTQASSIDLDNNAYRSRNDIYGSISDSKINESTTFTFISSFGTQLDIIDKSKSSNDTSTLKFYSIKATRVRVLSSPGKRNYLFGVFIFNSAGRVINLDNSKADAGSLESNSSASNALKIVKEINARRSYEALQNIPIGKSADWNNYNNNPGYCTVTALDRSGDNGGDWWEYFFDNPVDVSVIEIYGRKDNIESMKNMKIQIFDDTVNENVPVIKDNFGSPDPNARAVFSVPKP